MLHSTPHPKELMNLLESSCVQRNSALFRLGYSVPYVLSMERKEVSQVRRSYFVESFAACDKGVLFVQCLKKKLHDYYLSFYD